MILTLLDKFILKSRNRKKKL